MPRRFSGPLLPGTKSVKMVNRRNKGYKKGKFVPKKLASAIKKITLSQCETKYSCKLNDSLLNTTGQNFINNDATIMVLPNCLGTTPGPSAPSGFNESTLNRVGDQIIAKGIRFSVWLESVSDRQNVRFGIVAFQYNPQKRDATGASPYALNAEISKVFWRGKDGDGGYMNRFLDQPNPDKITVLKHIKLSNGSANYYADTGTSPPDRENNTHCCEFYVPLKNKKINYRIDDQGIPQWKDIGLCVYAFNQNTALTSDNVGIYSASSRLYFKDP